VTAFEAAVFDMDGLLVDSEVLWHEAELEILVPLGAPIDPAAARATKGLFVEEVVAHWHGRSPWSAPSVRDVADRILDRVGTLVESKGRLLPGALRALDMTGRLGPRALASSTPTTLIMRTLEHFDIADAFDVICSAEDEAYGKPHPAVFLTAAQRLGVDPRACVVFEDSEAGVLAAKAARMTCVAVPAAEDRGRPGFGIADVVLPGLQDLDETWVTSRYSTREMQSPALPGDR
jgi:sugar-phosphatase